MRVFKLKWFARFARQEGIADANLCEAVERAQKGLVDADLGGHVIKQRVARTGQGRSGGYRTIIAFRAADRAVFIFGFAKNVQDNIDAGQLATLKETARKWLAADAREIRRAIDAGFLVEVKHES